MIFKNPKNIPYHHPAWIEIDLAQFRANIALIRKQIDGRLLCLPVKANAYGHGLIPMAKAAELMHVDYLAVSCLQEGAQLREAGITIPILVMGAIHEDQIRSLMEYKLEVTVASAYKADLIAKVCEEHGMRCRVHIEVDTGMQRTGMRVKTALKLIEDMKDSRYLELVGAYSHLATAEHRDDLVALQQIALFDEFKSQVMKIVSHKMIFHIANSGGVCNYSQSYFDMVRPGILAFGYYQGDMAKELLGIKPFLSLKAKVAYFKVVDQGVGISYGHRYKTTKPTRIITVPVGYGDGYRRSLAAQASVLIRGKHYPVVGAICMDQLMVDIGSDEAYVGEEVILVGEQGEGVIGLNDIAKLCDTIPYEILCGFNQRLPRTYV
jgi:alanine racemase